MSVLVTGVFDPSEVKKSAHEIFSAVAQHNLTKILIDIRPLEGEMSTTDRFSIAKLVSNERFEHEDIQRVRMAIVGKHPIVDPKRFAETVARNRGVDLRVMTDIDEALEWLEEKSVG